jgi:hypothetical protein
MLSISILGNERVCAIYWASGEALMNQPFHEAMTAPHEAPKATHANVYLSAAMRYFANNPTAAGAKDHAAGMPIASCAARSPGI